jgi:hypothetical protein
MEPKTNNLIKPIACLIISAACLAGCALLTSPFGNVTNIIIFFVTLLAFLASLGYLIALIGRGEVGPKAKYKIMVLSLTIVLVLMFRSAQSLSAEDILILILIAFGALFYGTKRVV